ncbi:hypothetical protein [Ruminococcus flavefaciens]|uniref:hypothetical protein n=1 Tax=Ruminococcus flavefaciens TaxID=1265 RepID=UPI0026EAD2AB|nr:hypothetical protein [Ruminococcus flavefaciens]
MGEYYCPNCNADLDDQFGFDPSKGTWTCTECGQFLMDDDIADGDSFEGVAWFCDNCDALLNRQSGFSDSDGTWTCTECGYRNGITDEDILEDEHTCPNCGANLKKQYDYSESTNEYTCSECGSDLYRDYSSDEFEVIDDDDKCPNCGAFLKNQSGYSDYDNEWTCSECDTELHRDYSGDEFSVVQKEDKAEDEDDDDENDDDEDDNEDDAGSIDNEYDEITNINHRSSTEQYFNSSNLSNVNSRKPKYPGPLLSSTSMLSKREVRKKRIKAFVFKKKRIPIGYSSDMLKGRSAEDVFTILHNCGFKHIKQIELKDIYVDSSYIENEVDKVEFNGQSHFVGNNEFPYDSTVIITIHKKKEISIPYNSSSLRRLNYTEVCSRLSSLGFTDIKIIPIKDLVIGLLTKNGAVEKVLVNGSNKFKKNAYFKYDADIIVYYHTFKK